MTAALSLSAELPRVYLTGPIAVGDEPARGGFQACNRRTIAALRQRGIDVTPLPYPHPRARGLRKLLEYASGFLLLYLRVLGCESGSIVHVTAVGRHFIYLEFLLVWLARLAGCRVVYDVRAGGARAKYERATALFRFFFERTLRAADHLMVEGQAFQDFIEAVAGRRPVYLPNHLDTSTIAARDRVDPRPDAPTIVYVGRVVPEKGVETILHAGRLLRQAGIATSIRIVGEGDAGYIASLRARYADVDAAWPGPLAPAAVLDTMRHGHFFVFPTRHFSEGQSNALTEAMACGLVPIVSQHGFNEAVAGDAGVALPKDAVAADYARAVEHVWRTPAWEAMSRLAEARARHLYSTPAVVATLLDEYRLLVAS
jgi:glycosyltransferase involved in cell wall biosynthesis